MRAFRRSTTLVLGLLLALSAHATSFCQSVTTSGSEAALCQFAWYHFEEDAEPFFRAREDHHFDLSDIDKLIMEAAYTVTSTAYHDAQIDFETRPNIHAASERSVSST